MIRSRGVRPEFSVLNTERGLLVLGQDREWCAIPRGFAPAGCSLLPFMFCKESLCLV